VSSDGYRVTIGRLDLDPLKLPGPDPRLAHAIAEQDSWTAREHAAWWAGLLPQLVDECRRARPPTTDATSLAAALLDRACLDPCALGLAKGTIRRGARSPADRPAGERRRPSLERGHELIDQSEGGDLGVAIRRLIGTDWDPWLALPRAWSADEDQQPPDAYFNPMIPEWARPGVESDVLGRAEELLASAAGYPRCSLRRTGRRVARQSSRA
jgi:hypothetical protein